MSVAHVVRSRSRHRAFRSIRRQLLHSQRTLLLQATTCGPPSTASELPADVLDLATSERDVGIEDLMKSAPISSCNKSSAHSLASKMPRMACAICAGSTFPCLVSARNRMPPCAWIVRLSVKIVPGCVSEHNLITNRYRPVRALHSAGIGS